MDSLNVVIENLDQLKPIKDDSFDFVKFFIGLGPIIVGIVGMYFSYLQFRKSIDASKDQLSLSLESSSRQLDKSIKASREHLSMSLTAEIRQKAIEDERKEIYERLNDFYGPLVQLRRKSSLLYDRFRLDYYPKDENFRTLDYLLKGHEFNETEMALLKEIINIGKACENLIHSKSGLIDDKTLREKLLPQFSTHILILRLAFEGKLKADPEEYETHRFPRDIDEILGERISALEKRLNQLNETNIEA